MANCEYCLQPAGWFRKFHQQCKELHELDSTKKSAVTQQMISTASAAALDASRLGDLEIRMKALAASEGLPETSVRASALIGWRTALGSVVTSRVLDSKDTEPLLAFMRLFGFTQHEIGEKPWLCLTMNLTLRDILEGRFPSRLPIPGGLPFNLQKSERLIWLFRETSYLEEKSHTVRYGGYQGVSIRVARGMYYHVGGTQSEPVSTWSLQAVDSGMLGVTEKAIYFAGDHKGFRIPYTKIVTFRPFADGLGICRDAVSAKPQVFVTQDGWFAYNLVRNLASGPTLDDSPESPRLVQ